MFQRLTDRLARLVVLALDAHRVPELEQQISSLTQQVENLTADAWRLQTARDAAQQAAEEARAQLQTERQKPVAGAWREVGDGLWLRENTGATQPYNLARVHNNFAWTVRVVPPSAGFRSIPVVGGRICQGKAQSLDAAKHAVDLVLDAAGYRLIGGIHPGPEVVDAWSTEGPPPSAPLFRHLHGFGIIAVVNELGWFILSDESRAVLASGRETGSMGQHLADTALLAERHTLAGGVWPAAAREMSQAQAAGPWRVDREFCSVGAEVRLLAGVGKVGRVNAQGWQACDRDMDIIGSGHETGLVGKALVDRQLIAAGITCVDPCCRVVEPDWGAS